MHKKISVGLCLTLIVLAIITTSMVTTAVTMTIYSDLVSDLPEREAMYDNISEVDNLIRTHYVEDISADEVNRGMADAYLSSLPTGKNYYFSSDEYTQYKNGQAGKDENGNSISSVKSEKYNNAGYIRIIDFTDTTPDEFSKAFTSLKNDGINGIVIDVRNTDSINIAAAAKIIDMIVPLATEGTQSIATAVDRNNSNIEIFAADSNSADIPVSVIVNEKTSGAGELLACDIRDFGKGTVVGKTTAGNGTYQKVFELSDGGAVVLTVAKLLPYTSECFDGTGVTPDYETELKTQTDVLKDDTQFMQAYASVNTMQ